LEEDSVSNSLFEGINEPDTLINILIGAKKFMEGWNSWRVSNMGLLNIGRQEGSEIIQLFGRGVRLRGKDFSLKRSSALEGRHPDRLRLLEMLNIFAVRANYMSQFREYLEKEGVDTEDKVQLSLPIQTNKDFLGKGLIIPRVPKNRNFSTEKYVMLEMEPSIRVRVDMSLKVQTLESSAEGIRTVDVHQGIERFIPAESLDLVDWERVYLDLLYYKERKGFSNLVVLPETPRKIIAACDPGRLYGILADEIVVKPESFAGVSLLHEAVVKILQKYMDVFYRQCMEEWDTENMVYRTLDESDPNFKFNAGLVKDSEGGGYMVKVRRSDHELVAEVIKLISESKQLYKEETGKLTRLHFDRHLYQPLLVKEEGKIEMNPPGLEKSELQFVRDIKEYWSKEKNKSLSGMEVFLLRNLSRGTGIGFFEGNGFYPDFILWIMKGKYQRIIFLEPHGMIYANSYKYDEKARLHERLPELAKGIESRSKNTGVMLDSYIISATPYDNLRKKYDDGSWLKDKFADKHILFPERDENYDYIKRIFSS
jgi:hypothetical protein